MSGISKPKHIFNLSSLSTISPLPRNPKDVLFDLNWKQSMTDEFNALIENKTWVLQPKTQDMHIIRSMWILNVAPDSWYVKFI